MQGAANSVTSFFGHSGQLSCNLGNVYWLIGQSTQTNKHKVNDTLVTLMIALQSDSSLG